jgi:hypothetical protein
MYHNTFESDLVMANTPELTEWWQTAHRTAFPAIHKIVTVHDDEMQKTGVDTVVKTKNGTIFGIEEKGDHYTDRLNVVLELTANKKAGWVKKPMRAEILAYAFPYHPEAQAVYWKASELLSYINEQIPQLQERFRYSEIPTATIIIVPVDALCSLVRPIQRVKNLPTLQKSPVDLSNRLAAFKQSHQWSIS